MKKNSTMSNYETKTSGEFGNPANGEAGGESETEKTTVSGFAFNVLGTKVVLARADTKSEKWSAPGGDVQSPPHSSREKLLDRDGREAVARIFYQTTGAKIMPRNWDLFCELRGVCKKTGMPERRLMFFTVADISEVRDVDGSAADGAATDGAGQEEDDRAGMVLNFSVQQSDGIPMPADHRWLIRMARSFAIDESETSGYIAAEVAGEEEEEEWETAADTNEAGPEIASEAVEDEPNLKDAAGDHGSGRATRHLTMSDYGIGD